ncbi:SMP-LTD domain-containing protein [Mycena chlorophos]|uniref:SMP-LTD domain-containing protein n=1 Tax=Mycena chlorophos TaxID=658473 RepID=A0A8H6WIS6_MYCCL|nr:SMP-LTD domain-containing protein [Mycena chlorophos]
MSFKALVYAYLLGGLTFIPLVIAALVYFTIYTSVPVADPDVRKKQRAQLAAQGTDEKQEEEQSATPTDLNDAPKTRKAWLTMRRTFEETTDGSYVTLVRSFLDARSKDPKRSRPKDMWYVVLKGSVLYLYEDESMSDCEGAIELSGHDVYIYPEGLMDGELFAKRNAICLKPKVPPEGMPSVTREMKLEGVDVEARVAEGGEKVRAVVEEEAKQRDSAREQALNLATPWFIFVRSNVDMEDWYLALIHASDNPPQTPMLAPLQAVFQPSDMAHLVSTLDEQPDVIPMRWFNALLGRIIFAVYRTHNLEKEIIRRIMKKISKTKRPSFLTELNVTEVSVGNKAPTFSKPMLKELTKEGDASMEVHLQYKGEFRITIEATATISLGARFKSYEVKLVLAAVLKEIEGNLLLKIKRPPSNRIWYAFTQAPRMVFEVEPIVSDRQITWSMITSALESSMKAIIQESVVLPNMDDISFFETAGCNHRGGIWADSGRREQAPSDVVPQPPDDDTGSIASAPPATAHSPAPESESRATQSAVDLVSSSPPDVPEVAWSSTFSAGEGSDASKRRSFHSSAQSDGGRSFTEQEVFAEDETPRGRSEIIEVEKMASQQRSRSTPHPSEATPTNSEGSDDSHLQAPSTSSRGHGKSNSVEEYTPSGSPSTSLPNSRVGTSGSPTASTFLSTLRSRDKQAISNTAKETFRKWGANWSGLRKDREKDPNSVEDVSDSGSLISRLRPDRENNSNGSVSHKARQSYAEVRAAVAERRGRERGDGNTTPEPPATATSIPIPTPEIRERATTMLPGRPPNGFTSLIPRSVSDAVPRPGTPPPQPPAGPVPPPQESPLPIHVQPQAKSMVIPGIHAKNRNEVMSMGYVAPAPETPPDSRAKNPAIQSMYRLWKSPTAPASTTASSGDATPIEASSSQTQSDADVSPLAHLTPLPNPDSSPRPTPPPLPPRKKNTPVRQPSASNIALPETAPSRGVSVSSSSAASSSPPSTSASEALQSIADKDNDKRASLEGAMAGSPPHSRRATLSGASAAAMIQAMAAFGGGSGSGSGGEEEPPIPTPPTPKAVVVDDAS